MSLEGGKMSIPEMKLNNGRTMPQIALGLWKNKDREECIDSVKSALEAGYTHFDTAQVYGNEAYLAEGLQAAGVKREHVFITTKIAVQNFARVHGSFKKSLKNLQTDYVDLLLLHFPVTLLRGHAWKVLEEIQAEGGARSIGVSNYTVRHLEELLGNSNIVPAVNQVELHVYLQQPELLEYCAKHGIVVEAYSPLAHGHDMDNKVLKAIADKHGKSSAQIMIRWCIEKGTVPLPKSANPDRIKANIEVFDFSLDADDMAQIKKLEANLRTCWDPTHVA
jgi:diketogulonate reductase-like aldo/keto reductase